MKLLIPLTLKEKVTFITFLCVSHSTNPQLFFSFKGVCMKSLNNFFFGILCDESESDEDEDDPNTAA